MSDHREKTWEEIVAPTVSRCELAAKMGANITFNSDGARALGELIKRMAAILDECVERADGQPDK